ncbi:ubiquitin-related domain-containing protein, partial [Irpex lacteus]
PSVPQTPQVALTFLLVSGRRRNMTFEPETTVGRAKELVWNAWPNEWQDERPPAPSYLRILYLGKILQDEDTLESDESTSASPPPTIVHLSIRSQPPPGAKDAPKKMSLRRHST